MNAPSLGSPGGTPERHTGRRPVPRGTGLQPVCSSGILPELGIHLFRPFNPSKSLKVTNRNLPHWHQEGGTYFITFRLADSIPQPLLVRWNQDRAIWLQHHPQPWSGNVIAEYRARFHEAWEDWLDQGQGSCALRDPCMAQVVANALRHFDGERCVLDCFVVMPNHVHAIVKPLAGHDLSDLLRSWKNFTAREINKLLGRSGTFWMDESYDHLVRDRAELERLREYIAQNPVKAKLRDGEFMVGSFKKLVTEDECPGGTPERHTGHRPVPHFELCEIKDHDGWQKLPGRRVYEGPYVQIEECSFLTPARPDQPVPWTVAYRKSAVAVAPITEDGRFILIHQERLPIQRALWEFPAGQIDDEHSCATIAQTALREMDEEAGCELLPMGELTPLGWFFGSQGFTGEHVYLFVARPVQIVRQPQPVGGEHIGEVRSVTADELRDMVARNEVQDALTLALFARMVARGIIR